MISYAVCPPSDISGTIVVSFHEKLPATTVSVKALCCTIPPESNDIPSEFPTTISVAIGTSLIYGVALFTSISTVPSKGAYSTLVGVNTHTA